ncbi:MAG: PHP domain-containing protein [Provencibacterium sp.]|nr:PHP domain-containing protein [Provencibacterium sp.]
MIADLHCHSRMSDGSLGIDEIVFFAKRAGLAAIALTDHDTLAGVTRAQVLGKRYGLEVLPAVEISCTDEGSGRPVHLLCYLPQKPDRLEGMLKATLDRRTAAGKEMLARVMRFFPLTEEQVSKYFSHSQSIYRVHIMHALADLGYTGEVYGPLYEELFGQNGSCRVRFPYPPLEQALNLVRDAQGIAVIAHPGEQGHLQLCERLAGEGKIQGLEVYHPRNSVCDRERLREICERFQLIPTGGTDFHGSYSPLPSPLGSYMAPPDTVSRLFRYIRGR